MSAAEFETCFYCRKPVVASRLEYDHAPIPTRHGGTETVPACIPCHDLKDRIPARDWPVDLAFQAIEECGPLGRIFLAKAFAVSLDMQRARGDAA